ncbi:MAG TPA: DUF2076 domain-containing protein [Rickettsiales bacterium]|nr:DUF2076 domain-containing protein [Rickettsiales bacterium]
MTPQEQQMLADLLGRIAATPSQQRDPEADAMIQRALASRPDALYLLTQMALIHEIALKQAEQKINSLQQNAQPQRSSSFLGPWGQSAQNQQSYAAPQPQAYTAAPAAGSSFLHNVMTTASGVLAGEMAFSALHSLFGGGSRSSFLSGAPTETIVNNYYDNNTGGNLDTPSDDVYDLAADDLVSSDDSDFI